MRHLLERDFYFTLTVTTPTKQIRHKAMNKLTQLCEFTTQLCEFTIYSVSLDFKAILEGGGIYKRGVSNTNFTPKGDVV